MPINKGLIHAAGWRSTFVEDIEESMRLVTEPFSIADIYPTKFKEDDDGNILEYHEVLPHQQKIHDGIGLSGPNEKKPTYVLLSGGYGSGKSIAMTVQMIYLARTYPGIKIAVITAYDYYFDEFIWPTFRAVLGGDIEDSRLIKKVKINDRSFEFKNGSIIRFKAYDDPERVKGWDAHIIWIEEAAELGDGNSQKAIAIFRALIGRHRAKGNYPRIFYLSQNPKGHNWTYKLFVKPCKNHDDPLVTWVKRPNIKSEDLLERIGICFKEWQYTDPNSKSTWYTISSGSLINTNNPPEYVANMIASYDEQTILRMVHGDFNPMNILVYCPPYFDVKTHVIDKDEVFRTWEIWRTDEKIIPRFWPLWVGIDTAGQGSPWAIEFFVETPTKELIGIHEIYVKGQSWKEIAGLILDFWIGPLIDAYDDVIEGERDDSLAWRNATFCIDPISSKQGSGPNADTIYEMFREYGIPVQVTKGSYRKLDGISMMRNHLKPDLSKPHPYMDDEFDEELDHYEKGASLIYYMRDDALVCEGNEKGYCQPWNMKEKEVFRFDSRKQREAKEHEEGLSAPDPKLLDRDDHAQTAEFFICYLWKPPVAVRRTRKKRDEANGEPLHGSRYAARKRLS